MTPIERTLKNLHAIRLSPEVRSRMREELIAYAELHAATGTRAAVRSPFTFSLFRTYAGLAAVVLIVASVGGTAFAAEGALPGDTLYSVKTNISEPIQTALIPSTKGKAAWHAILAERRLDEAAQLAAGNKLTSQTQQEIAANLQVQVEASVANADRLQNTGDSIGSLDARSDLEARLTAHEQILTALASHLAEATSTESTSTAQSVKALLAVVQGRADAIESSRIALEHALMPQNSATATTTAEVAVAPVRPHVLQGHFPTAAPAARIATADAARTEEIESILSKHAALLATFMPVASTTATSTATTTTNVAATTTPATTPASTKGEASAGNESAE